MRNLVKTAVVLVLALFSVSSFAALTEEQVKQWVDAVPAVEQWNEENGAVLDLFEEKSQGLNEQDATALFKQQPYYSEFSALLSQYGFDDISALKNTSFEIFGAVMEPEMIAQIELGVQQSKVMLSDDRFDGAMKQNLEQSVAAMESMLNAAKQTTDADRQAIEPYKQQIMNMLDE